ncbi:MAG: HDOD domain-containing protein [Thauera sp.]|nr:HDOD domain-containing protein [Thauera sp.]
MPLLEHPLPSVQAYVEAFSNADLPVLRHTVRAFAALRESGENVGARHLAGIVLADPLMTMRLLTHLERHRRQSQNHDITTIERAVMMMGVEPFFAAFSDLPTVEDALAAQPRALIGVLKVITRARRAADYARDFAVIRRDLDVQEIVVATLLHEATEIVCWIHAPGLTLQVHEHQRREPGLRSATAQRAVFGVSAAELQLALIRAWHLPELLVTLLDDSQQDNPRVRTIQLAADFARHLGNGWGDAALPDDIAALEGLLHMAREPLLHRLGVPEDMRARFLPPAPPPAT